MAKLVHPLYKRNMRTRFHFFQYLKCFMISKAFFTLNATSHNPIIDQIPFRIEFDKDRLGQPFDFGLEAAKFIRELFRKHWNTLTWKISRIASLISFSI